MHTFDMHLDPDRKRKIRARLIWIAPLAIVGATLFAVGIGFLMTWLWRETISDIFGIKPITFWQAWGLFIMGQLLFKASIHHSLPTRVRHRMHANCCAPATPDAGTPGAGPSTSGAAPSA
jgi:hypothetical protein